MLTYNSQNVIIYIYIYPVECTLGIDNHLVHEENVFVNRKQS